MVVSPVHKNIKLFLFEKHNENNLGQNQPGYA